MHPGLDAESGICEDIQAAERIAMTRVVVGKWGNNLAIRVPLDLAKASGLTDGEQVEIELRDGDLMIRRSEARAQRR